MARKNSKPRRGYSEKEQDLMRSMHAKGETHKDIFAAVKKLRPETTYNGVRGWIYNHITSPATKASRERASTPKSDRRADAALAARIVDTMSEVSLAELCEELSERPGFLAMLGDVRIGDLASAR